MTDESLHDEKCGSKTPHNPQKTGEGPWCWFCYNTAYVRSDELVQRTLNHHLNEILFQLTGRTYVTPN